MSILVTGGRAPSPVACPPLTSSSLRTTLLRRGSFATNALGWAWPLKSGRPVPLPYPGAYSDPVHDTDIAEAAFAVLTDPAHAGGAHTLTGPQSLTFATQLAILGSVLGRPLPFESWAQDHAEAFGGCVRER
ncbi:hypothetical protein AB0D54_04905 [Streptomyces xanthophaeus]|uniref:SDR family oxidoreductase n=1 Tax=Streptomyces xanthophaeus TaxID=67385 RepID=UPI00342CBA4B